MDNDTGYTIIGVIALVLFIAAFLFIAYTMIVSIVDTLVGDNGSMNEIYWEEITPPQDGLRCWQTKATGSVWCEEQ